MVAEDIILKPVLTEKGYDGINAPEIPKSGKYKGDQKISGMKYTFIVAKSATKTQVKLAVEKPFGVTVEYVNTVNCKGKLKRMGRNEGYTSDYKKAIVQLTADSKAIEFFNSLS